MYTYQKLWVKGFGENTMDIASQLFTDPIYNATFLGSLFSLPLSAIERKI